ncbi:MAG: site-specific DNA-methyltransferase [Rhodospirillales bacterium]|nr:site-specific DNA-methyltransferase [Rhodospirillales bacterium]
MAEVCFGPAENFYAEWPPPTCIVCDGPYGVSGYPGDLSGTDGLAEWYVPHLRAWSEKATPQTTLWFWNTEIGWATVHPVLQTFGWEYKNCHIWDKGLGHVAGNTNTKTLRKLPVTTEVCVQYVRPPLFDGMTMQTWLRHEWQRCGLPLNRANDACGVANAATRKYLTADHLWYFPPPDAFEALARYANAHGNPAGRPYFSGNGVQPFTASEWSRQRAKFKCPAGITNVWRRPHVGGSERVNGARQDMRWKFKSLHGSQKPLELVDTTIQVCTDPGDVVWEPFGGLCPALVSSFRSDRACRSAEIVPEFYHAAVKRLADA